jgi:hypothetical protein
MNLHLLNTISENFPLETVLKKLGRGLAARKSIGLDPDSGTTGYEQNYFGFLGS